MAKKKKSNPKPKHNLHKRNIHNGKYDLEQLSLVNPELKEFVAKNKYGNDSIDFFNPKAVKALNKALLLKHYKIEFWDIPNGYLCPPVPGRADYLHNMADLLAQDNKGQIPTGKEIKCLDIGVGANCVYPIIGRSLFKWSFIGADIDKTALESAKKIIENNPSLKGNVELRHQKESSQIFHEIIDSTERIDFTICNPPFHESEEAAISGSLRKLSNLKKKKVKNARLNFGGQEGELWTEGGERQFVLNMIDESTLFSKNCAWFSTLVSKQTNPEHFYEKLKNSKVINNKTIAMGQGNKRSRLLAWTFLNKKELESWTKERWQNIEARKGDINS